MSLDAAMAEVLEALPPGWVFVSLTNHGAKLGWDAFAHTFNTPKYDTIRCGGDTAADALLRLAKALRKVPR